MDSDGGPDAQVGRPPLRSGSHGRAGLGRECAGQPAFFGQVAQEGRTPILVNHPDHLTFNAPVLTVIFLLVAVIVGWWSRYTTRLVADYE